MIVLPRVARRISEAGTLVVVAFGSSTTEGVGASSPATSYPSILQTELRAALPAMREVRVVNRGVGGENSADMLKRVERDAVATDPDLVIWQSGTNDALRQDPVDRFVAETREALIRIEQAGINRVLMEPQWCPLLDATPNSTVYLEALRRIADDLHLPLYRRFDLMVRWRDSGELPIERMIAADGLHLQDACYAKIAHTLADDLLRWAGVRPEED